MLCEQCGLNEAVRHYRITVNGETEQHHLCASCAAQVLPGLDPWSESQETLFPMPLILSELVSPKPAQNPVEVSGCPGCGSRLADISQRGQAGCAECYSFFSQVFTPYVQRMYGKAIHTGRIPRGASQELRRRRALEQLREELQSCIKDQNFEKAAELRDQIRTLEQEGSQ